MEDVSLPEKAPTVQRDAEEWKDWLEWKEWRKWKELRQRMEQDTGQQASSPEPDVNAAGTYVESSSDKTQYVISGQATGWSAMAQHVRDFDEEKLRDCKEDIDTLLVFAGLFSAVLTAFLVESYHNLQEDTSVESLAALRQLVLQTSSYQLRGDLLNTTASASPSAPPFQPSPTDIIVNVLWFASLLFSLTTASFGILVKQWLREYLAVDNPSPQARLRVRHLRYPQLIRWQVFEIAAFLPLLLQVALALFFLGMCYFTSSVHPSVRNTTLPLVAGWAFCFIAATLLPIFFPRCPYKTTLLKRFIFFSHRCIESLSLKIVEFCAEGGNRPHHSVPWKTRINSVVKDLFLSITRGLDSSNESRVLIRSDQDINILIAADAIQSNDELLGTSIAEALSQAHPNPDDMLAFVDGILTNRMQPAASRPERASLPVPRLNIRSLTVQARAALARVVHQYIDDAHAMLQNSRYPPTALPRTVLILSVMLSVSQTPLPQSAYRILRPMPFREFGAAYCFALVRRSRDAAAAGERHSDIWFQHQLWMAELLQGLTALWPRLDVDLTTALVMLNGFLLLYLNCEGDLVFTGRTLPEPLTTDVLGRLPLYMASDEVLFRAFGFLLQAINVTIQSVDSPEPRSPETTNRVSDALEIVFFLASGATRGISSLLLDWRQDNLGHSICHRMMARPDLAGILANVLLRIPSQWVTPEVLRLFIWHKKSRGGVAYPNTHVSSASISNWVHAVTGIFEDPDTDASELDALKICCFTIYTFWPGDDGARITSLAMSEEWASLFDTLSKRIAEGLADSQVAALPSDSRSDERRRLAGECLRIICYAESKLHPAAWKEATGECSEADYQHWLASFESFSPFGDHLIDVLDSTASSDEFSRYWRIRRSRQAKGSRMQNMVDQTATDVCHD